MAAYIAEQALLEKARGMDQEALAAVYDRFADRIYRYLYRRVGDPEVAEDLTAQTFTRMLEALHTGRQWHTSFHAWLYRIAHNLAVDYFRQKTRMQTVSLEPHQALKATRAAVDPFAETVKRLQRETLVQALEYLTPDQAQVIRLRFLEGYTIAEVAQIMGKTEGAVKALQFRAIARLRVLLEEHANLVTAEIA